MRRVAVVGSTASGKTRFAVALARRLGVPHVELDAFRFQPGWVMVPDAEFRSRVDLATRADGWVTDGNYGMVRDLIWERAEVLVWLDYPLVVALWRLWWRTLRRLWTRELLWDNNRESFRTAFLSRESLFLWLFKTHRQRRRDYPAALREFPRLRVFRFTSSREAERWLASVEPAPAAATAS